MATIVGGIATSHTPTIGFALDAKKHNDPVWAPIFAGYQPVTGDPPTRKRSRPDPRDLDAYLARVGR